MIPRTVSGKGISGGEHFMTDNALMRNVEVYFRVTFAVISPCESLFTIQAAPTTTVLTSLYHGIHNSVEV